MKKLLSILMLLVAIVIGARATDFVDTYGSLGAVTGDYIANGISKIALGENATANSGIQASDNDATMKFTVSTPTGFTIKTVRFKNSNVSGTPSTNDAGGTVNVASSYTTYTASSNKSSVEFTVASSSGKKAKLTEFTVTVTGEDTEDYELITPTSISSGVISYTSSLGDDKLVTAMAGVGGPSVGSAGMDFGSNKGFSITTSRPIKAVYVVWYQRAPIAARTASKSSGWGGYSASTYQASELIGTYDVTSNKWTAGDNETQNVYFVSTEGSSHKLSSIHIFYYASNEPSISADNININEGAVLDGEISFSVEKKGTTGTVSAVDDADWLTLGEVDNTNGKVPFTATANTAATSRSATVTLTYTYNTSETVTKNVTITQAAEVRGTEIIKAVLKDSPTGTIGGTADYNTQNRDANNGGCKLGSDGHYVGIKLATGNTFRNGDIIKVNIGTGASGNFVFYEDKGVTAILETTEVASTGLHTFVLPAAVDGKNSIYLYRHDSSFNPYVDYISVTRPNITISLNASGYATYSKATDFEFAGAKAYKMNLNYTGGTLQGTEVTGKIKAGEGVLFKGEAGAKVSIIETTGAETLENNSLVGTTPATGDDAPTPDYTNYKYFVLKGKSFVPYTTATTFGAGKAFFQVDKNAQAPASFELVFDGEATAVEAIAEAKANTAAPVKVIKNGKLYIGNYNVAGARIK